MAKRNDRNAIQSIIQREDSRVSANIDENYIFTTEDKIKILYDDYNSAKKYSGASLSLVGILITLVITLCTCDFKPILGLNAEQIKAFFIFTTIVSSGFLLYTAIRFLRNRHKLTFIYFLDKLKGNVGNEDKPAKKMLVKDVMGKLFKAEKTDTDSE
jgi:hypothetical protein